MARCSASCLRVRGGFSEKAGASEVRHGKRRHITVDRDASRRFGLTHQFSFWVSGAILSSTPSFSGGAVSAGSKLDQPGRRDDIPRSLMLKTPLTVLLVLRCFILPSLGDAGAVSSTAESTLVKDGCSWTSADIVAVWLIGMWDVLGTGRYAGRQASRRTLGAVVSGTDDCWLAGWMGEEKGELLC